MSLSLLVSIAYAEKFSADLYLGYGSTKEAYDSTGKSDTIGGSYSVLNLALGGKYYVFAPELGPKIYIGGKFGFTQNQLSNGGSTSSGFSPQYLSLLLGGSYLFVNGKVGFQLDLGPEMDFNSNKIQNSDRQNAILVGLGANVPFMAGLGDFHASFDYVYTLSKTENNITYDNGDYISFVFGGGYKVGLAELVSLSFGLDIVYWNKTKGDSNSFWQEDANNLSLVPYFKYKTGPLSIWAKLGAKYGWFGEYTYSGISIMGKNSLKTLLGFTIGLNVSY
ncbi:MAG: hypothetical protein ABIL49_06095 [candidate division WOR-3 bacterium]